MKNIKILTLLFLFAINFSFAQSIDEKLQKIVDIQAENFSKEFNKVYFNQVISSYLKDVANSDDSILRNQLQKIYIDETGRLSQKMNVTYTKIYKENLSNEEINTYYEFINSKNGISIIKKMPSILNDAIVVMRDKYLNDFSESLQKRFEKAYKDYLVKNGKQRRVVNEDLTLPPPPPPPPPPPRAPANDPFREVDKQAQYNGDWAKFLQSNLVDFIKDIEIKNSETIRIEFVVDIDGSVSNVKALNGSPILQKISELAILKSGNWLPAEVGGKKVKAYRIQKIIFQAPK